MKIIIAYSILLVIQCMTYQNVSPEGEKLKNAINRVLYCLWGASILHNWLYYLAKSPVMPTSAAIAPLPGGIK